MKMLCTKTENNTFESGNPICSAKFEISPPIGEDLGIVTITLPGPQLYEAGKDYDVLINIKETRSE